MSQDAPVRTRDTQVLVSEKVVPLPTVGEPEMLMSLIARGVVPAFDSVTCSHVAVNFRCVPKSKLAGVTSAVPVDTLIAAIPVFVASVTEAAITLTWPAGTVEGAK